MSSYPIVMCSGGGRYETACAGTFLGAGFSDQPDGPPVLYLYFRDGRLGDRQAKEFGWPASHFRKDLTAYFREGG